MKFYGIRNKRTKLPVGFHIHQMKEENFVVPLHLIWNIQTIINKAMCG